MPKERLKRARQHASSVPLPKRQLAHHSAAEQIAVGSLADTSGNDILKALSVQESKDKRATKKEKHQLKHEAWVARLGEPSSAPYSKSHAKRLKRKAKEQLVADMTDMRTVLLAMDSSPAEALAPGDSPEDGKPARSSTVQSKAKRRQKQQPGMVLQIGEGKGQPLSSKERKSALSVEQMRLPMIMQNPSFASNPFETIRIHAQNTLVKHEKAA